MSFLNENDPNRNPQTNFSLISQAHGNSTSIELATVSNERTNQQEEEQFGDEQSGIRRSRDEIDDENVIIGPAPSLRTPVAPKRMKTQKQLADNLKGSISKMKDTCKLTKELVSLVSDEDALHNVSPIDVNKYFFWSFKDIWSSLDAVSLFSVRAKVRK